MEYQWHDYVGNVGVVLILGTYALLQLRKIDSRGLAFSVLNAVGAGLIIVSLVFHFNKSAMIVEIAWCLISLAGIVRWRTQNSRQALPDKETV